MKWFIQLLLAMVSLSVGVEAKPILVNLDGAFFKYDDSQVIWELYYSFPDTILKYIPKNDGYEGELHYIVTIKSSVKIEDKKEWIVTCPRKNSLTKLENTLLGQKSFLLSKGQYTVDIEIFDENDTSSRAKTQLQLITKDFPKDRITISDIQLAQVIQSTTDTSAKWNEVFKKGDAYYVIPNPSLSFIGDIQNLNFYFELYNGKKLGEKGIKIEYIIFDAAKREVALFPKVLLAQSDAVMETASLPIDILPTGVYYLQANCFYPAERPLDSCSVIKKFYLLNPQIPPSNSTPFMENVSFEKSEWATLTEEQTEMEYKKAKIIAIPYEDEKWNRLSTVDAKKRFLFAFWKDRDKDTTSALNEELYKFRELIEYANKYFSYGKTSNGWSTDRGRVLLKYGQPTQRDIHTIDGDKRAYESWYYDVQQGGIEFHFVDLYGYSNFIKVHSTAIGELRNINWYNQYVPKSIQDPMEDYKNNPSQLELENKLNQPSRR